MRQSIAADDRNGSYSQAAVERGPGVSLVWQNRLAIGAILACLLVNAAGLMLGVDELDEGYFAEQASRVLRGELPYRDFESLYTPGLLYLHTLAFNLLGGPELIGLRVVGLLGRAGIAFGLYALGRSLVPPFWAVLPGLFILIGLDTAPAGWEPHPSWYSTLWTVVTLWLVAQVTVVSESRRRWFLLAAGAAAGAAFLFKQNSGVFLALGTAGYLLLQGVHAPNTAVTMPLKWFQRAAYLGLVALVVWLMRPYLLGSPSAERPDPTVILFLLLPLVAVGALLVRGTVAPRGDGFRERFGPIGLFTAGFVVFTLPWLAALVVALGGQYQLLGPFVGAVEQSDLFFPFQMPTAAFWPVVALAVMAVVAVWSGWRARIGLLVGAVVAVAVAVVLTRRGDDPTTLASVLLTPDRAGYGIVSVIPPLAVVAGLWLVRRSARTVWDWRLRWYLAAGVFGWLTQYPRMDVIHLTWSAPLLFVVGAVGLHRLWEWLAGVWRLHPGGRMALAGALVVLPLVATFPNLYLRAWTVVGADPDTGVPRRLSLLRIDDMDGIRGFRVQSDMAGQLIEVVNYVKQTTGPGEAIFAYPSMPLLYVLMERPNPTRYGHVYPSIPPAKLAELFKTLDPVETVVISDAWLYFWDAIGRNQDVEHYIEANFDEAARFGVYRVLKRAHPTP